MTNTIFEIIELIRCTEEPIHNCSSSIATIKNWELQKRGFELYVTIIQDEVFYDSPQLAIVTISNGEDVIFHCHGKQQSSGEQNIEVLKMKQDWSIALSVWSENNA